MSKYMIADITWNSKGWEDVSHDKSNFGWVKEHPRTPPGESWNFDIPKDAKIKRGFFQVRDSKQPVNYENGGIIFFFSRNNDGNKNYIVGLYAKSSYVGKKESFNIVAPAKYCLKLYKYVDFRPSRHLPTNRVRIPQVGYTYITERNARNILEDALKGNSIVNGIEANADPRSDFLKLSRIAKSYFSDIRIPRFRINSGQSTELPDFVKKEFPNFSSDDRIAIIKNNAKLKRSYARHQDLLNRAIDLLREKGWRKLPASSSADLLAQKRGTLLILEAKSVTSENLKSQVRTGISQLYEYSFDLHAKGYEKQKLVLLLEKQPDRHWFDYCDYCGVELWYKENKVIMRPRHNGT